MLEADALLAKSTPPETLLEHTEKCLSVWSDLRKVYSPLAERLGEPELFRWLFLATALHDLGKAASGFQKQLRSRESWGYRHELLSAAFVQVLPLPVEARAVVGYTVATHHRTVRELLSKHATIFAIGQQAYEQKRAELRPNWPGVQAVLTRLQALEQRFFPESFRPWSIPDSPEDLPDPFQVAVIPIKMRLEQERDGKLRKLLIVLNGLLMAADHLASAGEKHLLASIRDFRPLFTFPELNDVQRQALTTERSALLVAPTGYGKTEAALLWTQANQTQSPGRRVYYVLPYTASINAMYERFRKLAGRDDVVGVQHSRAGGFLNRLLEEQGYGGPDRKQKIGQIQSLTRKIYRAYKITTPYQLVKAFFGGKHFEMEVAAQAGALFVYDEIHVYDARTTGLIVEMSRFLAQETGADFLVMSATLPRFLRQIFREAVGARHFLRPALEKLQKSARHRVHVEDGSIEDAIPAIQGDLQAGKRVLVVCNTVKRAQEVYRGLKPHAEASVLLHGRFIGHDRNRIESRLDSADLLVGTQAIEVSLDIDFDTLYTEPAPIDALLQRFGRVNRRGRQAGGAPVVILSEGSESDAYIYPTERVDRTLTLLRPVDRLTEDLPQRLVDEVYGDGYVGKDAHIFEETQQLFRDIIETLKPGLEDQAYDEPLQQLFQGVQCVPAQFKEDYFAAVGEGEIYEAEGFTVNMSLGQFLRLRKLGRIHKEEDQWFVDAPYDPEFGLNLEVSEASPFV